MGIRALKFLDQFQVLGGVEVNVGGEESGFEMRVLVLSLRCEKDVALANGNSEGTGAKV